MPRKQPATVEQLRTLAPSIWFRYPDKHKAAKALVQWNDESITANWSRASRVYMYSSAYEGYTVSSLSAFGVDVRSDIMLEGEAVPILVNRIRAEAQTFVALTGANDDPVPQFVTNGGDYEQQQAAQNMDDVICAEYGCQQGGYADFHALCRKLELMVTTALGRGWVFVFPGEYGGRWKPEAEIDDGLSIGIVREHQYGRVLTLCRSTWRDPEWLMSRTHKKHHAAILRNVEIVQPDIKSGGARIKEVHSFAQPCQRLVRVIQGWHISTGKDDPGREMFTLKDGHWFEDNEWTRPSPPCRHIDYDEELSAAGGTPLTQTIYRMFCRENEMLDNCDKFEQTTPLQTWVVPKGTVEGGEIKEQLESAEAVKIIEVTGSPKEAAMVIDSSSLPRKTMELLTLYANLQHEIPGIARGHSDAAQPNHVSSGVQASLEASLFPERHADFVMRFSRFRAVDCAELFVWAIQDIIADKQKYETWAGDPEVKRLVKADALDLDLSKYRVQIKPASDRKDSVATRQQKAERWLNDPKVQFTGADMNNFWKTFDVDSAGDELTGVTDGVRKQLRKWRTLPLDQAKAKWRSPAKWMTIDGLQSALRIVVADYEDARDGAVPEPRLRLWENYMNQCVALIRALRLDEAKLAAEAQLAAQQSAGAANGSTAGAAGPTG
jgi:hypothetical protein